MLRGAVETPIRSTDAAGTLVVGGFLTALGWIVTPLWLLASLLAPPVALVAPLALAPTLVARGYFLRVVAGELETATARGAPRFVRWGGLYRDGVKSALLTVAYLLPLVICLGAVAFAGTLVGTGRVDPTPVAEPVFGTGSTDPSAAVPAFGVAGGLVVLLAVSYLLAFAYVRPAAVSTFAATGRLRDAFRPTLVWSVATSSDYAVGWSLATVVVLTGYVFALPFVPLLVGIGVVFAVRVVAHALYGRGAADALSDIGPSGLSDGRPTPSTDSGEHAAVARAVADPVIEETAADGADGASVRGPRGGPVLAEAPVDVQIGRSVPTGSSPETRTTHAAIDCRSARPDAFDPADAEDDAEDDADGGFHWGPGTDG